MVQCPNENDVCISDLRLDWTTRGQIVTHIIRGCKESELVPKECTSGSSSLVHYKDCTESCITPGCNSELDGVAHKFVESSITRGVNECNTCKYVQGDDGSVTGNKYCLDQPNKIKGVKKECPLYAQEGLQIAFLTRRRSRPLI